MIKNYQVNSTVYDGDALLDENNFYKQHNKSVSKLSKTLTYLLGHYNQDYPISFMTSSSISKKNAEVELDDLQFTYPVMGREDKASVVASNEYGANDKPGIGNRDFFITFTDNWIKRFYIIESPLKIQAWVKEDPVKVAGGYRYKVQLNAASDEQYCPPSELNAGTLWSDLNSQVAESESRGTESKMASPGSWKNQMGAIRTSMQWSGNSANKVMDVEVVTDKGRGRNWMDFFMWQFEKRWLNECEHSYWYSRYNRKADGTISLKDPETGKPIPTGSGILEQIQNKSTYSKLTYNSLVNKIADAYYGQSDTDNATITLMTGKGGMREIDQALVAEGAKKIGPLGAGDVASKFVTGSGRNLVLGGFFTQFYHIDGYTIKVKHNKLFDHGKVAMKSPRHPETNLPLESYRMVFIDDSEYDGEPNIQCVTQKGRRYLHGVIPGMTPMPRSLQIMGGFSLKESAIQQLSTDKDASSYHRFAIKGVQIRRATKCFDLECVAGL